MPIPSSIRINKYISDSGMCSRRDADRYVENGRVLINDMQAEFGAQVFDGDVVPDVAPGPVGQGVVFEALGRAVVHKRHLGASAGLLATQAGDPGIIARQGYG